MDSCVGWIGTGKEGVRLVRSGGRGRRKDPDVIYTRSFLDAPGSKEELRDILLWWEVALARRAQEKLRDERRG